MLNDLPVIGGPWTVTRWATLAVGALLVIACTFIKATPILTLGELSLNAQMALGSAGVLLMGSALKTPGVAAAPKAPPASPPAA